MAKLKEVTPEQRLLVKVKRLRKELDLILAEYEAEIQKDEPARPFKNYITDPETGKKHYFQCSK